MKSLLKVLQHNNNMPFYTFKCPSCNKEEDVLQSMNADAPKCKKCNTIEMKRVFKVNAKPGSKDGSWNFGKGGG